MIEPAELHAASLGRQRAERVPTGPYTPAGPAMFECSVRGERPAIAPARSGDSNAHPRRGWTGGARQAGDTRASTSPSPMERAMLLNVQSPGAVFGLFAQKTENNVWPKRCRVFSENNPLFNVLGPKTLVVRGWKNEISTFLRQPGRGRVGRRRLEKWPKGLRPGFGAFERPCSASSWGGQRAGGGHSPSPRGST